MGQPRGRLTLSSQRSEDDGRLGEAKVRGAFADRDILALAIAFAGIILFVGTGGSVMPQVMRAFSGNGLGPDRLLTSAFLLNIALIIFGWRRYRDLCSEMRERRVAETQARLLAETDPLTGCLNRRSLSLAAQQLVTECAERNEAVAMVMLDLDNFKQVNDYNSHSVGDSVLKQCAQRITEVLPERSVIARVGGDEFACVVPFTASQAERIDALVVKLLEAAAKPADVDGLMIETTVSAGIARSDIDRASDGMATVSDGLSHMADIAMYQAKKQGRNRYCWYEWQMEDELRRRSELEAGIRKGVENGEFVPYYEQQIDLRTGELTGFEMLARWHSPELGLVSPEVFISVAEEIGVISDLSESVISQALADARHWDSRLTLSVNISPLQLRDPWFAQKLLKVLVEANFPPSRLEIEITESCLHENIGVVRSLITSLKNQGVRVSLDDFGTGYSSLAQLQSLPFDRIKIDRSFVTNLSDSTDNAAVVKAIIDLGKGLNLPITAEGIDNREVLDKLNDLGEFKGQGYLYGRPQPADETNRKLAEMNLLRGVNKATVPAEPVDVVPLKKVSNG